MLRLSQDIERRFLKMKLSFDKLSGYAICRFRDNIYLSNISEFSYTFKSGAYALVGQIDNSGWGISYSLSPICKKDVYINRWTKDRINDNMNISKFYLNDKEVTLKHLQSISCYLGHYVSGKRNLLDSSAKNQLTRAIRKENSKYSMEELKSMFGLTEERFDRPLYMTGNEVWRITAAVGLANGKRIFCFPWLTNNYLKPLIYAIEKMAEIIKKNDGILLLPVENADLIEGFVDDIIVLGEDTGDGSVCE